MADIKTVFMHYVGGTIEDVAMASVPGGFSMTRVLSQASDEEKIELLKDAEYLIGFGPLLSEDVLKAAPKLKFIQLASAGYDSLNLGLLRKFGIPLATATGANAPVVAEHTILLILSVLRKLPLATAHVAKGGWNMEIPATDPMTYHDLVDKTVGIIGFGNIAQQVTRRLQGFDCHLQVFNREKIDERRQQEFGITQVELRHLLETSDVVSIHVPLTSETKNMIGAEQLAQMKSSAIIINTARGAVIDEAALIKALQTGQILGAGIDTTTVEPPALENPLRAMENVVLTPHIGGSIETMHRVLGMCWHNIRAFADGKEPSNVVSD